jgi:CobQ/CobB/MinD/ParA nucleotide binding domain
MTTNKRLIFILGGKGGTGKTTHCRQLFYFLIEAGVNAIGLDADVENCDFLRFHANAPHHVNQLDFLEVGEAKDLFTILDRDKPDVVLVDMPGASSQNTRDQWDRFGAFQVAKDLGYRITLDTVLNNEYNTIASLKAMIEHCKGDVDYVAVRNRIWAQGKLTFHRWENSGTRTEFLNLGGVELDMPLLEPTTFDAIHEKGLSFFDIDQLDFGDRLLARSFLTHSLPELEKAAKYLGLPTDNKKRKKKGGNSGESTSGEVAEVTEVAAS